MTIFRRSRHSYGYTLRRAFGSGAMTRGLIGKHPGALRWLSRSPTKEQLAIKQAIQIEQVRRRVSRSFFRRLVLLIRSIFNRLLLVGGQHPSLTFLVLMLIIYPFVHLIFELIFIIFQR